MEMIKTDCEWRTFFSRCTNREVAPLGQLYFVGLSDGKFTEQLSKISRFFNLYQKKRPQLENSGLMVTLLFMSGGGGGIGRYVIVQENKVTHQSN